MGGEHRPSVYIPNQTLKIYTNLLHSVNRPVLKIYTELFDLFLSQVLNTSTALFRIPVLNIPPARPLRSASNSRTRQKSRYSGTDCERDAELGVTTRREIFSVGLSVISGVGRKRSLRRGGDSVPGAREPEKNTAKKEKEAADPGSRDMLGK